MVSGILTIRPSSVVSLSTTGVITLSVGTVSLTTGVGLIP